jgi:hypothetical protein
VVVTAHHALAVVTHHVLSVVVTAHHALAVVPHHVLTALG